MQIKSCSECVHHKIIKSRFLWWYDIYSVCSGPQCVDMISGDIQERRCSHERMGYGKYADSCVKSDQDRHDYIKNTACGITGKYWEEKK